MNPTSNNPYSDHQDIALLLPWYVNQSLQGAEQNKVEQHLKVCLTCRRELVNLKLLAAAVQHEGALDTAAQASFSLLKKRLHGPSGYQAPLQHIHTAKRRARWRLPKPALALAAVVLLSLLMPRVMDVARYPASDFRTLSNGETQLDTPNSIKIIFTPETDSQHINTLLTAIHGHIIDGPNEQRLYTISLDNDINAKQIVKLVAALRKQNTVIFAEPAYALLSSTQPAQTP